MRGYLKSFNAKTGALEWQTYTIPAPGEPGSETWPKDDSWKTGGGPTWLTGSYDADTDTLYWGVGNPGSWQSDQHPGDNLWTDSMLALDPDTGKIKWGYQYTPNDAWDYDGMATPILVDTTIDGKPTKAAVGLQPQRLLLRHRPHRRAFPLCDPARRGHQLDDRPRSEDRQADDQRSDEAEARRRQDGARRSFPASRAAPTGSRRPTIRDPACSSSPSTSGAWG